MYPIELFFIALHVAMLLAWALFVFLTVTDFRDGARRRKAMEELMAFREEP